MACEMGWRVLSEVISEGSLSRVISHLARLTTHRRPQTGHSYHISVVRRCQELKTKILQQRRYGCATRCRAFSFKPCAGPREIVSESRDGTFDGRWFRLPDAYAPASNEQRLGLHGDGARVKHKPANREACHDHRDEEIQDTDDSPPGAMVPLVFPPCEVRIISRWVIAAATLQHSVC